MDSKINLLICCSLYVTTFVTARSFKYLDIGYKQCAQPAYCAPGAYCPDKLGGSQRCGFHAQLTNGPNQAVRVNCECNEPYVIGNPFVRCFTPAPPELCMKKESCARIERSCYRHRGCQSLHPLLQCVYEEDKYSNNTRCECITGYEWNNSTSSCEDIDECLRCEHNCHKNAECENTDGSFKCNCKIQKGLVGNGEKHCNFINKCNDCEVCDINARCEPRINNFTCSCNEGWTGCKDCAGTPKDPCMDFDECAAGTHDCGQHTVCENTKGSFICPCINMSFVPAGSNSKVCLDVDECKGLNHCPSLKYTKCRNYIGGYSCDCIAPQYKKDGSRCVPDIKYWCKLCDCNTTQCLLSPARDKYTCECLPGFKKDPNSPEKCVDIPECSTVPYPCHSNADCTETPGSFNCKCTTGFTGNGFDCISTDPCVISNPCLNYIGMVCSSQNENKTASCVCTTSKWTGKPMVPNPHIPNVCIPEDSSVVNNCSSCDNVTSQCVKDSVKSYIYSCGCTPGYEPQPGRFRCRGINECMDPAENTCDRQRATCIDLTPHRHRGRRFECKCNAGYQGSGHHGTCKNINECALRGNVLCPSALRLACVDTVGSYKCVCQAGFIEQTLNGNKICLDFDECLWGSYELPRNALCVNTEGNYTYKCRPGFVKGKNCCNDINECAKEKPNPCSHYCLNHAGGFECSCGGSGKLMLNPNNKTDCLDIDECKLGLDNCVQSVERCVNEHYNPKLGGDGYHCDCKHGFNRPDGHKHCIDIDECASANNHTCDVLSECKNLPGAYKCVCLKGMIVKPSSSPLREQCRLPNPCVDDVQICGPHGVCHSETSAPYYSCKCHHPSVAYNKTTCLIYDYCDTNYPCPNFMNCRNAICSCKMGYEPIYRLKPDFTHMDQLHNRTGCKAINRCNDGSNDCDSFTSECNFTAPGQFECPCRLGFRKAIGGQHCEDDNECLSVAHPVHCPNNSECVNTIGSYRCECLALPGALYTDLNKGNNPKHPNCTDVNECLCEQLNNCTASGEKCINTVGGFECDCAVGFAKTSASNYTVCGDIDECKLHNHTCSTNGHCINTNGSYMCQCNKGCKGNGHKCSKINECEEFGEFKHNCSIYEICVDKHPYYECKCVTGYKRNHTSGICQNINECCDSSNVRNVVVKGCANPCSSKGGKVSMECSDTMGSYTCHCPDGYHELEDGTCTDNNECNYTVCHGENVECVNIPGSYQCQCQNGFEFDPECKHDSKNCTCRDTNECHASVAACGINSICLNRKGAYDCECPEGYKGNPSVKCIIDDVCKGKGVDCKAEEVCDTGSSVPRCVCRTGYRNHSNSCYPDPCVTNNGNCEKFCASSYKPGGFVAKCHCPTGYQLVDGNRCEDINECKCVTKPGESGCRSKQCPYEHHELCYNNGGSYKCVCNKGYQQDNTSSMSCVDINECKFSPCNEKNHEKCKNTPGSFVCQCPPGQRECPISHVCTPDYNCSSERNCAKVAHSFCSCNGSSCFCQCEPGYGGNPKKSCNKINHCEGDPCGPHSKCTSLLTHSQCDCVVGFEKDAKGHCVDICDCCSHPCPVDGSCIEKAPGYACSCKSGYEYEKETNQCKDINECLHNSSICDHEPGTIPVNTPGSYRCVCNTPHYEYDNVKKVCIDVDECKTNHHNCPSQAICSNTVGRFNCSCPTGAYTERRDASGRLISCHDVNECASPQTNDCDENAICKNLRGSFRCVCDESKGYIGSGYVCYKNSTHCGTNCGENAYCLAKNAQHVYNCTCLGGYEGDATKKCTPINVCDNTPGVCGPNAFCSFTSPGKYSCECVAPYKKKDKYGNCTELDDPCGAFDDCPDDSTCAFRKPPLKANKQGHFYECECINNHYKFSATNRKCEDINECSSSKTNNCPALAKCTNHEGGYDCVCPHGYIYNSIKNVCADIDECQLRPVDKTKGLNDWDQVYGCITSSGTCVNTKGSWRCNCPNGFTLDAAKKMCKEINECLEPSDNNCNNVTTVCKNVPGSFKCECKENLTRISSTKCEDMNECWRNPAPCGFGGKCINLYQSYRCECAPGFTGLAPNCKELPNCDKQCGENAFCRKVNKKGVPIPTCFCYIGYQGDPEKICENINECVSQSNSSQAAVLCPQYTTCTDTPGCYWCKPDPGYRWNNVTVEDINECDEVKNACLAHEICLNTFGSYKCLCKNEVDGVCYEHNECTNTTLAGTLCDGNATCMNAPTGYYCVCNEGYTGTGKQCTPLNECEVSRYRPSKCSRYADCTDKDPPQYYECKCKAGWKGNGTYCTDIDECEEGDATCPDNSECINTQGSYICICNDGYRANSDWRNPTGICADENECLDQTKNLCNVQSTECNNLVGSYKCDCKLGYIRKHSSNLYYCDEIDECKTPDQCGKNPVNICKNLPGSYACECGVGYTQAGSQNCQDIDECLTRPCDANAACVNTEGSYTCNCNKGYRGNGRRCKVIDPCKSDDCDTYSTVCKQIADTTKYTCPCKDPAIWQRVDEKSCQPIPFCTNGKHKCNPTTENCEEIDPAGYRCTCKAKFAKNSATNICEDVNECLQDPAYAEIVKLTAEGETEILVKEPTNYNSAYAQCIMRGLNPLREGCLNCAMCQNTFGGFGCDCWPGLVFNNVTKKCEDTDECNIDPNICTKITDGSLRRSGVGWKCQNRDPGYACECPEKFYARKKNITEGGKDYILETCDEGLVCANDLECQKINPLLKCSGAICTCPAGYKIKTINQAITVVDIDECTETVGVCGVQDSADACNIRCMNNNGSYNCACPPGTEKKRGSCFCKPICNKDNCKIWFEECRNGKCSCKYENFMELPPAPICTRFTQRCEGPDIPISFRNKEHFFNHLCKENHYQTDNGLSEDLCFIPASPEEYVKSNAFLYHGNCTRIKSEVGPECLHAYPDERIGRYFSCAFPKKASVYGDNALECLRSRQYNINSETVCAVSPVAATPVAATQVAATPVAATPVAATQKPANSSTVK